MFQLYNVLSSIAVLLYLPQLLLKKGVENKRVFIVERLGKAKYSKMDIWVHAVSVGEVLACIPFLKRLKQEFPAKKIMLSTTTHTGQKIARNKFSEADRIMYMPLDALFCINRVVRFVNPELFITVETELWPGLFEALKKNGSHNIIVNGRISKESFKGYKKICFFMKRVLSNLDFIYMQTKEDAARIIAIGADSDKVGVMGNVKFDISFDDAVSPGWLTGIKAPIFLAASTHKGEDEIILDAFSIVRKSNTDLKLIIAPRHPERFNEVAELITARKLRYLKRSEIGTRAVVSGPQTGGPEAEINSVEVVLLDTMGELSRVFSKIDIAFMGGSLVPSGGHNMMEPAYWSKPVIFGPHMDNFPMAKDFLELSAALEVKDADEIAAAVIELLKNKEKAMKMGSSGKVFLDKNTGAVEKAIELVRRFIGTA